MPNKLQALVRNHCAERNLSARNLAERIGIGYPAALALLRKGAVPRKPDHREKLREELGLDKDAWAQVVASSERGGIDIPEDGPLTLQQLVKKTLLARGHTEQSFAKTTGIPYPTIMGITRKGAVPRQDTLKALAEHLEIEMQDVEAAISESRATGKPTARTNVTPGAGAVDIPEDDDSGPLHLAQAAQDAVHRNGDSIALFGKMHGIPYLELSRLIRDGRAPESEDVLEALAKALPLSAEAFAAALADTRANPTPATPPTRESDALTPLQAALIRLVEERKMTVKAFADAADLSVLTATRLLKRGDLPGRTTTNLKLRTLLGLSEADYANLLTRSRAALGLPVDHPSAEDDDHDDHPPTPAPPNRSSAQDDPLVNIVGKLDAKKRKALASFLKTLED